LREVPTKNHFENEGGDPLSGRQRELPPVVTPDHTKDHYEISSPRLVVGVHKHCNGEFFRRGATETHDALVCGRCYLRVLFPREVETYGELRQALKLKLAQPPE